jgi:hypothetical protein
MTGMMNPINFPHEKATFITRQPTPSSQEGDGILNPKVTMIIHQCFPLIIERHEKDPVSSEISIGSLERYRKMGYDAIRNLPEAEKERDRRAIDDAFQESAEKIHEIGDRKKRQPAGPGSDDPSPGPWYERHRSAMARTLSPRDLEILKKLAPEVDDPLCPGSGHAFFSILPPVSNHFAASDADFLARIERLSDEDLGYLAGLILDGAESVGCMHTEHVVLFADEVARRVSMDTAEAIIALYTEGGPCEQEPDEGW